LKTTSEQNPTKKKKKTNFCLVAILLPTALNIIDYGVEFYKKIVRSDEINFFSSLHS